MTTAAACGGAGNDAAKGCPAPAPVEAEVGDGNAAKLGCPGARGKLAGGTPNGLSIAGAAGAADNEAGALATNGFAGIWGRDVDAVGAAPPSTAGATGCIGECGGAEAEAKGGAGAGARAAVARPKGLPAMSAPPTGCAPIV